MEVDKASRIQVLTQYLRSKSSFESESEKDRPLVEVAAPPDGGLTAWFQVFLTHLVCLNTWGFIISFGAFQTFYHSTLPNPQSDISWLGSIQAFLIYFIGAWSGRALDAGYFHLTYGAGVVLTLVGIFSMSFATQYWHLVLSQGLCVGIGMGLQFCPAMGLVGTYFQKNRVFALALAMSGAGTGGLVYPAMIRQLLENPNIGFPWTVRIVGFLMLVTGVFAFIMFKPRLPPRTGGAFFEFAALKEPVYLFFVTGMFFNFWALYFEFYYLGVFARTMLHTSYATSVDLLLLTNGVGLVGRLLPAFIANKYTGPLNLVIPGAIITGLAYFSWIAVNTVDGVWAMATVYAFGSNVVQGLWPSTLGSLTTDVSKSGARMGLGFTIVSFGVLTGPPLGGALVTIHGYKAAQIWGGVCLLLAAAFMFSARTAKTGFTLRQKI